MVSLKRILWRAVLVTLVVMAGLPLVGISLAGSDAPVDLPVLRKWNGDYPVARLDLLPEHQRRTRVGYLGDAEAFAEVWKAFKPGEGVPEVDFGVKLVVFSRNVDYYNRTAIFKVGLKNGVAEILAMETLSAIPIGDNVAMAMAEVPRAGIRFLQSGQQRVPVSETGAAANPLDATYSIEDRRIRLRNGRHEVEAAPGSAAKAATRVFGLPVSGDLDGDGDEDAVLFLTHDPGGSGTFYYVAAAVNEEGLSRGTNAVLLGDRISPEKIGIQNGVVFVDYADRRPDEPMAAAPSVARTKVLVLRDGRLTEIRPPMEGEKR
jgi:hypothetical protein